MFAQINLHIRSCKHDQSSRVMQYAKLNYLGGIILYGPFSAQLLKLKLPHRHLWGQKLRVSSYGSTSVSRISMTQAVHRSFELPSTADLWTKSFWPCRLGVCSLCLNYHSMTSVKPHLGGVLLKPPDSTSTERFLAKVANSENALLAVLKEGIPSCFSSAHMRRRMKLQGFSTGKEPSLDFLRKQGYNKHWFAPEHCPNNRRFHQLQKSSKSTNSPW